MKPFATSIVLLGSIFMTADEPKSRRWTFEEAEVGKLPAGWSAARTGDGPGSVWKVLLAVDAPNGPKVLAQTSGDGPKAMFNLCVANETKFTDVDLGVAIMPREGEIDQGGGLVWRYKDANNYYIARINPLEDNYRVYKVVAGKRMQLGSAEVAAPAGKWHTLHIMHKGDHIQCSLNGKLHLDVRDDTFKDAGKIGLWTKSDAVSSFDDLSVTIPKD